MRLGAWLKENRWTKAELARRLHVSQNSVRRWTNENKKPNAHMRALIDEFTKGEVTYE